MSKSKIMRTHHEGCWRYHLECAVRRVEMLENQVESYEAALEDGVKYVMGLEGQVAALLGRTNP